MSDPYAVLGVSNTASNAEIKAAEKDRSDFIAYRKNAEKLDDKRRQEQAVEMFFSGFKQFQSGRAGGGQCQMGVIGFAENNGQQFADKWVIVDSKNFHFWHLFRGADGQSGCLYNLFISSRINPAKL